MLIFICAACHKLQNMNLEFMILLKKSESDYHLVLVKLTGLKSLPPWFDEKRSSLSGSNGTVSEDLTGAASHVVRVPV